MKTTRTWTKSILAFCIFYYLSTNLALHAQITIGNDQPPAEGAILQLKMNENTNQNSHKGLGLPRVNLINRFNLFPMFDPDGSDYMLNGTTYTKIDEDANHIGLWLYNTNICLNEIGYSEGAYVWDEEEWQSLVPKTLPPDIKEFVDTRDGEVYTYKKFGDAGIWMLENLRARRMPNDINDIPFYNSVQDDEDPSMGYPSRSSGSMPWKNSQYYDENPKLGILYNWYAATNTTESTAIGNIEQAQETSLGATPGSAEVETLATLSDPSNPSVKFIQGICPDGWHLPSDREWNLLERQIYQNAEQYSTYTPTEVTQWNTSTPWGGDAWEIGMTSTSFEWRGVPEDGTKGHAYAMMAPCSYNGATRGKSKAYWQGGFCALLTGAVWTGYSTNFGTTANFWSSSSSYESAGGGGATIHNAWYRTISNDARGVRVLRYENARTLLFSVRCKKNNNEM